MKINQQIAPSLFAALVLAALSSNAFGAWQEIEKFEDGMRIFVDQSTAHRTGDLAEVHHLVRWSEPQKEEELPPYLSTVVRVSYNCVSRLEKYAGSTSYAGPMGNGAEVTSDDDEDSARWYTISESSMEDKLWRIACDAK